jgi:uncharacterized protein (DUF362 family)
MVSSGCGPAARRYASGMGDMITRRRLLAGLGAATLGGAAAFHRFRPRLRRDASGARVRDLRVPGADPAFPELAIAESEADPAALTEKALAAMGTLARFVARGDVVLVKPNIGWVRTPLTAANTNPEVVATIVRAALRAGARRVIVADGSCEDPGRSYEASGIAARAADAGAEVWIPGPGGFQEVTLHGRRIERWPILSPVLTADRVINVPVAKHHSMCRFTGALKSYFGILGGDRPSLHRDLSAAIADANRFLRPTLTVVDATRVLLRNGPKGGNLADAAVKNAVAASLDPVAADAWAARLLGVEIAGIDHLVTAEAEGLGTTSFQRLRIRRV